MVSHLAPFRGLPEEVHAYIMQLTVDENTEWFARLDTYRTLGAVSRIWRHTLFTEGYIWRVFELHRRMRPELIHFIIERASMTSGPLAVTVVAVGPSSIEVLNPSAASVLPEWAATVGVELAGILTRVENLTLNAGTPRGMQVLMKGLHIEAMVELRQMTVKCYTCGNYWDLRTVYPSIPTTKLTTLELHGTPPAWLGPLFYANLQTLSLNTMSKTLDWPAFRTALASIVELKSLTLCNVRCTPHADAKFLALRSLREFYFLFSLTDHIALIRLIHMPKLSTLTLRGSTHAPWSTVCAALEPLKTRAREIRLSATSYSRTIASFLAGASSLRCLNLTACSASFTRALVHAVCEEQKLLSIEKWLFPSHSSEQDVRTALRVTQGDSVVFCVWDAPGPFRWVRWQQAEDGFDFQLVVDPLNKD
ncbi:hypothetical protein R3P38DRAFT_2776732 [Favolaschia claudopus]|uniref:F-box domain-containing protein n=1 Tax=Favolaschia claudopus TaxID=2862362 RepID=A0AAW0BM98_9AGAR